MDSEEEKKEGLIISDLADPDFPERQEIVRNIENSILTFLQRPEIPVYLDAFQKIINRIVPPAIKFLSDVGEFAVKMQAANDLRSEIYPKIIDHLNFLATKTWFVSKSLAFADYELLAFSPERIGMEDEDEEALNDQFVSVYKENMEYFENLLLEEFPNRAFAIRPAIQAHRRGEFALSIPVFLSQADGILLDLTSAELFTSNGHISKHAQEQMSKTPHESWFGYFDDATWSPLSAVRPIGWSPKQRREAGYSGFNRHTTMHGMDLHYATEVNSYKAFSLLCYVASVKSDEEEGSK